MDKNKKIISKELPEYVDGYRQLPRCLLIFIFPIYSRVKYIRAVLKRYVYPD